MMKDKNYRLSAEMIDEFGGKITATSIDMPRCLPANELAKEFSSARITENCIDAVADALENAKGSELVCVCGSLYLAGEIRKHFK